MTKRQSLFCIVKPIVAYHAYVLAVFIVAFKIGSLACATRIELANRITHSFLFPICERGRLRNASFSQKLVLPCN